MNRRSRSRIAVTLGAATLITAALTALPAEQGSNRNRLAPPEADAACTPTPVRSTKTLLYDDDELNTYATVFVQVTRNCDRTYTERWGYYPNRHYNRSLRCTAGVNTRAIVVNPSSVYGYNAGATRFACRAYGASTSHRWRPSGTDRAFNAYAYADKAIVRDPHVTTPTRWAARR